MGGVKRFPGQAGRHHDDKALVRMGGRRGVPGINDNPGPLAHLPPSAQTEFVYNDLGSQDVACEDIDETPWAQCPRDVKLDTFPKLPDLLKAIIDEAEKASEKVRATEVTLKEILSGRKGGDA
jgi:hypothetical protein